MTAATKAKKRTHPAGELRQSQVVTTFGPGSMVDLPRHAVILGGLDHWYGERERVYEERLEARICQLLELEEVALYKPPIESDSPAGPRSGMTAFLFPTWFLAQVDLTFTDPAGNEYRTRPMVPWQRRVRGGWLTPERRVVPVVPVRFVQACVKGHISDIDWYAFVRRDFNTEPVGQLWLDEGGAGNDFSEIYVRCETTGLRRPLADAAIKTSRMLGTCGGRQPWLGPQVWEPCEQANRLLVRSASMAYYSQTLRAIAIPDTEAALRDAVNAVWEDFLQYAEDVDDLRRERRKQKVANALEGFADDAVWSEIRRRKSGTAAETKGIKQAEIETLMSSPDSLGEDVPDSDFFARTHRLGNLPPWLDARLERVVLVHRLREVVAQLGFTRFEAVMVDDDELSIGVEVAPLAREVTWLPAIENKGEGVFLAFREAAVREWLERPAVQERGRSLEAGFEAWRRRKDLPASGAGGPSFPGLPYILLQSLSHLLITALSLACGYAASSVRERIYAGASGYGILLYTASAGSEGTLGGLVDVGRRIDEHLRQALEMGRLCSNDPVCAQHDPANVQEERFLHGAACHGCLLIAETSCERRNELLDRALVVPTVRGLGAEFFPDQQGFSGPG